MGNVSGLSKSAIQGALSKDDVNSLNLSDKMSMVLIQSQAMLEEIEKNQLTISFKILNKKEEVKRYNSTYNKESSSESYYSNECPRLEKLYRTEIPEDIRKSQESANTNSNYLNHDGCRRDYCRWEESQGGFSSNK